MSFDGLNDFTRMLEAQNELHRIRVFTDPVLEITEIADRVVKNMGKALLFENTGTEFPLLINAFASDKRMALAIGRTTIEEAGEEITSLFESFGGEKGFFRKLASLPQMIQLLQIAPRRTHKKGACQEVIIDSPDLSKLPVLKCWPYDGGRFITLPLVHTRHPLTLKTNLGMYRMQIMGSDTTGMHWHRHKTGARHYEAWKEIKGSRMPVTVTLGGDPVYTYAATAPMPENIDEYLLAGFLRKKRVKLVKCLTNDLWVPEDSDFVIEGYVDTSEKPVWEGPFGDHTGFYSLADWYPLFHVTCITHRKNAIYPATIVGVPPMEDAWIGKATEKIFAAPIKMAIAPEIDDLHMPFEGVAHNLVLVTIDKSYPGQGMKVLGALFGAGQMMFSKYIVVLDKNIRTDDYNTVVAEILKNADLQSDVLRLKGPLDVLDHSSDTFSYGTKMGIDATTKTAEELAGRPIPGHASRPSEAELTALSPVHQIFEIANHFIIILPVKEEDTPFDIEEFISQLPGYCRNEGLIVIVMDKKSAELQHDKLLWLVLSNTDPGRDIYQLQNGGFLINACSKCGVIPAFPREWPNIVCSDIDTIKDIDRHWASYGLGERMTSPSLELNVLVSRVGASVNPK
jgi:4-hydroxy-3-polyprenylbenzoate decarboxylase